MTTEFDRYQRWVLISVMTNTPPVASGDPQGQRTARDTPTAQKAWW